MPLDLQTLTEKGLEKGRELLLITDQIDELENKKELILKELIEIANQRRLCQTSKH